MRVESVTVKFDSGSVTLSPRSGMKLLGRDSLYPQEIRFVSDVLEVLGKYKDHFLMVEEEERR